MHFNDSDDDSDSSNPLPTARTEHSDIFQNPGKRGYFDDVDCRESLNYSLGSQPSTSFGEVMEGISPLMKEIMDDGQTDPTFIPTYSQQQEQKRGSSNRSKDTDSAHRKTSILQTVSDGLHGFANLMVSPPKGPMFLKEGNTGISPRSLDEYQMSKIEAIERQRKEEAEEAEHEAQLEERGVRKQGLAGKGGNSSPQKVRSFSEESVDSSGTNLSEERSTMHSVQCGHSERSSAYGTSEPSPSNSPPVTPSTTLYASPPSPGNNSNSSKGGNVTSMNSRPPKSQRLATRTSNPGLLHTTSISSQSNDNHRPSLGGKHSHYYARAAQRTSFSTTDTQGCPTTTGPQRKSFGSMSSKQSCSVPKDYSVQDNEADNEAGRKMADIYTTTESGVPGTSSGVGRGFGGQNLSAGVSFLGGINPMHRGESVRSQNTSSTTSSINTFASSPMKKEKSLKLDISGPVLVSHTRPASGIFTPIFGDLTQSESANLANGRDGNNHTPSPVPGEGVEMIGPNNGGKDVGDPTMSSSEFLKTRQTRIMSINSRRYEIKRTVSTVDFGGEGGGEWKMLWSKGFKDGVMVPDQLPWAVRKATVEVTCIVSTEGRA